MYIWHIYNNAKYALTCTHKTMHADYGPLHGFWAFPFERYNGLLGEIPNNKKSIEVQMMNRFIQDNVYMSCSMPDTFTDLKQHIPTYRKETGSLLETSSNESMSFINNASAQFFPKGSDNYGLNSSMQIVLPNYYTRQLFTPEDVSMLHELYSKLYYIVLPQYLK